MLNGLNDNHILAGTFMLVLLLGIPTYNSLMEQISEPVPQVATATVKGIPSRGIASIPTKDKTSVASALPHYTQFDLNCNKNAVKPVVVHGGYVQFQGKTCLQKKSVDGLEIVNISNGYTASIFNSGSDKYQTDLIQLKHGDNEIAIRYRESSGKPVEQIIRIHSNHI